MFKRILATIIVTLVSTICYASSGAKTPKQMLWPFEGVFGTFDRQAAQRGAQVYLEVCSACHGLNHLLPSV